MAASDAHILVVDDDSRLRELIGRYLGRNGYRVTAARDAADARAKLKGMAFDLLIVDVMMPGESGTELVGELRRGDQVPVLMLTAMSEPQDRIKGLESGADDYLAKPFEPRELLLRVTAILRRARTPAVGSAPVRFGSFKFDPVRGDLRRGDQPIRLTTGETALLRALARNPGNTVARDELAARAGIGAGRATDVQVTRLRRKIEADPKTPRYLQTVWGKGYVLWTD